jgi:hypothetical protein
VLGAEPLRDDVVHVARETLRIGAKREHRLTGRQALERRDAVLDHEPPTALEMRCGVLEARDLRILRDQIGIVL